MRSSRTAILAALFMAAAVLLPALENLAQNRPFIRWKQIGTGRFTLIYPAAVEDDALHVGELLEYLHPHLEKTVGAGDIFTRLLLFTEYAESNGFTMLPPRRMVFFNAPPQNGLAGSNDWYTLLAIHEYRHMLQLMSLKRGMALVLYALLGEQGLGLAAAGTIPLWYAEGDAVLAETLFTKSGRGRMPKFDADFRAQLLSGKTFGYYQSMFGSYREYNPLASPYLLGYFMTVKMRKAAGGDIFAKINRRAMWLPLIPYRYTHCVDALTGKHAADWYDEMLAETAAFWKKRTDRVAETSALYLEKEMREDWTASTAPQYGDGGCVVVYRRGIEDPPGIVRIDPTTEEEKLIAKTGSLAAPPSVQGKWAVWADLVPDPRWTWRSFSDIFAADISSGAVKRITRRGRFYAPSLSPDGKTIAAVEFNEKNQSSLALMEMKSGKLLGKIAFPGESIITPRWSRDGGRIVFVKIKRSPGGGLGVFSCDAGGANIIQHIPYGHEQVLNPLLAEDVLYYVSPYSGIDMIRAMDLTTGKKYQVVSRKFGAYYPSLSPDGSKILFSVVTAQGHLAAAAPLDKKLWTPLVDDGGDADAYFNGLQDQEDAVSLDAVPHNDYQPEEYHPMLHAVNLHSWTPLVDPLARELVVALQSDDIMDTSSMIGGYSYNWNEKTHAGFAQVIYAGWYPVISLYGRYGTRFSTYETSRGDSITCRWREGEGGLSLSIPLDFSQRGWDRGVKLAASMSYIYVMDMEIRASDENGNGSFVPVTYTLSAYNAYGWIRDINPVWGQRINIGYSHTPFGSDYRGEMFFAEMKLFFPSLFRHHSLYFQAAVEMQWGGEYHYSSRVLFSRGYAYDFSDLFLKGSVNYTLPLLYPDLNLYVFYVKRIYFNAFFDYGIGLDGERRLYRSAGGELVFEGMPLGYQVPVFIGARYAYRIDIPNDPHFVGIFFGLAL